MTTPPHGPVRVLVRDRAQGKTYKLVEWLLAEDSGPLLDSRKKPMWPYWKRVLITCHGQQEKARLQRWVQREFMILCAKRGWLLQDYDYSAKAIWTVDELKDKRHGRGQAIEAVEFAVDDLGWLLDKHVSNFIGKRPEIVTIDGVNIP